MRVGTSIGGGQWEAIPDGVRQSETLGYDFLFSSETSHNPFFPLVIASQHTVRLRLQTAIALAFTRSPMDMAYAAWDLQALSGGRFTLGLGSQVRGHIVRRFSSNWTSPIPRMRDYIGALRSIWNCWQNDIRLDFRGTNYDISLMTPFFNPGPIEHPDIKIQISAVNAGMLNLAGEICDGVVLHPFNSEKYTKEVVMPNLKKGAEKAGRTTEDFDINGGGFIATGQTEEEVEANKEEVRQRIAFYASTPNYSAVMKIHGWDDKALSLQRLSKKGKWSEMIQEVTEDMVDAFAVVGTYDEIVERIKIRYASYATSVTLPTTIGTKEDEEHVGAIIKGIQRVQ